jgi:hypothetical protein
LNASDKLGLLIFRKRKKDIPSHKRNLLKLIFSMLTLFSHYAVANGKRKIKLNMHLDKNAHPHADSCPASYLAHIHGHSKIYLVET